MALKANALVTLAITKDYLEIPIATTAYDIRLERLINAASQAIAKKTRRVLVTTTHTEYQDGRASNKILLHEYPITGGPASGNTKPQLAIDSGSVFAASSIIDPAQYQVDNEIMITFIKGGIFSKGYHNIQIIYEAGEGDLGLETIPSDLEQACLDYVLWLYDMNTDRHIGQTTKSKGGESTTYDLGIPSHVIDLLEPYIRHELPSANVAVSNT